MEYRILYFYRERHSPGQEKNQSWLFGKRRFRRFGSVSFSEKKLEKPEEEISVRMFFCGIPAYDISHIGQLYRLLQNCCVKVSAETYYLEEALEQEVAKRESPFFPGRQRMCGGMIRLLSSKFGGIDSILYLPQEKEEERQKELPLPEGLLRRLHYFFYAGEKTERYFVLEENLWREYGMPLFMVKDARELMECRIKRLLVLDDRQEGTAEMNALPRGSVYLDLWSNRERQAQAKKSDTGIKYLSEYLYLSGNLDTSGENRYNTLD